MANHSPSPLGGGYPRVSLADAEAMIEACFDADWYRSKYPDIAVFEGDPLHHFLRHGALEARDPNPFFDSAWYASHYRDVPASGLPPLLHYLQTGAARGRNPHPGFDASYYINAYPEAAANPLLFHLQVGRARGYPTAKPIAIEDYLPAERTVQSLAGPVTVDIVIPVSRGLALVRRCIRAVLADRRKPLGRVIVVEDNATEAGLSNWLAKRAEEGEIHLLRNPRRLGFAASVNRGLKEAGDHDVVLLAPDIEVPTGQAAKEKPGWLERLAAQAYADSGVATVSPLSNGATICGYPSDSGAPILPGQTLEQIDTACHGANQGRFVMAPATSLACMYMRRDALNEVGPFDPKLGPWNRPEDADFCPRASDLSWQHRLACDVFVGHAGGPASPDAGAKPTSATVLTPQQKVLAGSLDRFAVLDPVAPSRFALTGALLRSTDLPVILMVSHDMVSGVRRHIGGLLRRYRDTARILLLEATDRGATLSVPWLPGHPVLPLPGDRVEDMARVLKSMNVSRVHIHHLASMDMDIGRLIRRLGVPFDVTVHDYHALCPQTYLLPLPEGIHCGEPDIAGCNACITHNRGAHYARDILSWRLDKAWQFHEADRVICPSADVKARLERHGLGHRAIVAPHEASAEPEWRISLPKLTGPVLRVVLLGTQANHKGLRTAATLAASAPPGTIEVHCIGALRDTLPEDAARSIHFTGPYQDEDLPRLLRQVRPHAVWLPSSAPETYSYVLSSALEAGLPIVATNLGAFTERLAGRPFSWLVDHGASTEDWLTVFDDVRRALREQKHKPMAAVARPLVPDFYAEDYLAPPARSARPPRAAARRGSRPVIAIVPERFDNGALSPCAYIRLLQPLTHPMIGGGCNLVMATPQSVLGCRADIIVTQRYALPDVATADALAAHAERSGAKLVYDLDDDLLNIPRTHPDAEELRPKAKVVRRMLDAADAVWVSTRGLAERLKPVRPDARIIENGLDERIWTDPPPPSPFQADPVRFLCMGTSTHDRDFALIAPALERLVAEYPGRVAIDILGMTSQPLPPGLNRIGPSGHGSLSYPGFVHWMNSVQPAWHIGLAPLLDTPFNRSKSAIKTMDYAALGLVVMASDTAVYQGSLADGAAGQLVPNDTAAWYQALSWMVRDQDLRRSIATRSRAAFLERASLASQAKHRRDAWMQLLKARPKVSAA